jgi:hypothetical protein
MENGCDTFALQSSEVITLPLDTTLVFSTNLALNDLMDEAYLRRITYKIPVSQPTADEFMQITLRACDAVGLDRDLDALNYLVERLYGIPDIEPKSCYARDLMQTIVDTAAYYDRPAALDRHIIDWAIRSTSASGAGTPRLRRRFAKRPTPGRRFRPPAVDTRECGCSSGRQRRRSPRAVAGPLFANPRRPRR